MRNVSSASDTLCQKRLFFCPEGTDSGPDSADNLVRKTRSNALSAGAENINFDFTVRNITSAELQKEPQLKQQVLDLYMLLFNNEFPEFLVCRDCDIQQSGPEIFETGGEYVGLDQLYGISPMPCCPQCQKEMEFYIDPQQTEKNLEEKFKKDTYLTLFFESSNQTSQDQKLAGMAFGSFMSLKEAVGDQWGHPYKFMKPECQDPALEASPEPFAQQASQIVQTMGYAEGLDLDQEVFSWDCAGFAPDHQKGGNVAFLMHTFWNALPPEKMQDPRVFTIFHVMNGSKMHEILGHAGCVDMPGLIDDRYMVVLAQLGEMAYHLLLSPSEFKQYRENTKQKDSLGYIPHVTDNKKIKLFMVEEKGRAVFATEKISAGEVIAVFRGPIYRAKKLSDIPNLAPSYTRDHVVQIDEALYLHGKNCLAELINHSCDPNCGIKEKVKVVAMRDIQPGEEIVWDYEMTEDSDWEMNPCQCGSEHCRGIIRAYRFMPEEIRQKYLKGGFVSEWLENKYHK